MTPEGKVKKMVKKALDTLGADCWRFMPVQTGFGSPALDYLLSIRGRFVALETKAPGKKLTPLQEGTKAAIEAAGGIVLVVWDEGSLAIALKIILALEFAPDAPQKSSANHLGDCLEAARGGHGTEFYAERVVTEAKAEGTRQQHLRKLSSFEAVNAAAGGDHGTPGAEPE
jgi:hypothetical protein